MNSSWVIYIRNDTNLIDIPFVLLPGYIYRRCMCLRNNDFTSLYYPVLVRVLQSIRHGFRNECESPPLSTHIKRSYVLVIYIKIGFSVSFWNPPNSKKKNHGHHRENKMDYRLLWFVKCINNVFEIGTERDAVSLFGETLNKDEGFLKRQFVRYLESSTIDRNINTNIFYVYTTTVKKIVKEEIEVEEEREWTKFSKRFDYHLNCSIIMSVLGDTYVEMRVLRRIILFRFRLFAWRKKKKKIDDTL